MTSVALPEELLLLAFDDETGKATVSRIALDLGMAAAVLVELALAGRIAMDGTTVVVRDTTGIGAPVVDAVLARMATSPPNTAAAWVQRLRHGLRDRMLEDLCARGIVRDVGELALEHITLHRYPALDASVEHGVRARLASALRGETLPGERTAALATLLSAVRMEPTLERTGEPVRATQGKLAEIAARAGFAGDVGLADSTVRPSVALVVATLTRAVETALGHRPA